MTIAKKPQNDEPEPLQRNSYTLSRGKTVMPLQGAAGSNEAADLIRTKLTKLYATEPDALQEEREAEAVPQRSKHQQFMFDLNHSGKDLALIQTEWHNYYLGLDDQEKHQVWQEFYADSQAAEQAAAVQAQVTSPAEKIAVVRNQLAGQTPHLKQAHQDKRTLQSVQQNIHTQAVKRGKLTRKQHLQSLFFGLGIGALAVFIFLFGFFNEVIIAPFIQPGRASAETPLIISSDTVAPTATPEVIIPKINVQIPVNFSTTSTDESVIENDLESGIVHYPTTATPGQNGNAAFFGHSSNNIFNKGKYKFAFVLLHELVPGDTFYITNNGKVYAYKVFSKTVVPPSDVAVLNPVSGHNATATLITCDPPGTSLNRLIIVGDQISPDPGANTAATSTATAPAAAAVQLAGNGKTLWGRFISLGVGKTIVGVTVLIALVVVSRKLSKKRS